MSPHPSSPRRSAAPSAELEVELDEVLGLLPLVTVAPDAADAVFDRLARCLARRVLLDIRRRHDDGDISGAAFIAEMCRTSAALCDRGLLAGSDDAGT